VLSRVHWVEPKLVAEITYLNWTGDVVGFDQINLLARYGAKSRVERFAMSPDQCRAARERLNWTCREFSEATDVPLWFIAAFEDGKVTPAFLAGHELAMRDAFEAFGICFQFEIEDGKARPAGVTYTPPDSREGSPSPSIFYASSKRCKNALE